MLTSTQPPQVTLETRAYVPAGGVCLHRGPGAQQLYLMPRRNTCKRKGSVEHQPCSFQAGPWDDLGNNKEHAWITGAEGASCKTEKSAVIPKDERCFLNTWLRHRRCTPRCRHQPALAERNGGSHRAKPFWMLKPCCSVNTISSAGNK